MCLTLSIDAMTKSKAILVFIVLLVVAVSIGVLTANGRLKWADEPKNAFKNKGLLKVICEVEISRPTNGLGQPFETEAMTIPAEFDFEEKTGGIRVNSLSRKIAKAL